MRATGRTLVALVAALMLGAPTLEAQYRITAPSGAVLEFEPERLLAFRDRSDSLRTDLEEDPDILYYTAFGRELSEEEARDAYPWNAVEVVTDSLAAVVMPGNLREAGRAYTNYAVLRMNAVRKDADVPCDRLMEREVFALDGFVDGWVAARTLFGGPAYEPLDELAFARAAGVLDGLIADRSDRQLGGCLAVWREDHAEAVEAYRRWRAEEYVAGS